MDSQIQRLFDLVLRTGDRLVVTDTKAQNMYVLMSLEAYEALLGDRQMVTPPVHPQAMTHVSAPALHEDKREPLRVPKAISTPPIWEMLNNPHKTSETWDLAELSQEEVQKVEEEYKHFVDQPTTSSPQPPVQIEEAEIGEEQFYLEPLE